MRRGHYRLDCPRSTEEVEEKRKQFELYAETHGICKDRFREPGLGFFNVRAELGEEVIEALWYQDLAKMSVDAAEKFLSQLAEK